jgi:hypothetical protein
MYVLDFFGYNEPLCVCEWIYGYAIAKKKKKL